MTSTKSSKSCSEYVFKPLSQGCIQRVYFYSAVNGYGSKPPYGCKIEWSWWKMGTEIIEGESWCHTGLSLLLFSTFDWVNTQFFCGTGTRWLVGFMRILITSITCLYSRRICSLNVLLDCCIIQLFLNSISPNTSQCYVSGKSYLLRIHTHWALCKLQLFNWLCL